MLWCTGRLGGLRGPVVGAGYRRGPLIPPERIDLKGAGRVRGEVALVAMGALTAGSIIDGSAGGTGSDQEDGEYRGPSCPTTVAADLQSFNRDGGPLCPLCPLYPLCHCNEGP